MDGVKKNRIFFMDDVIWCIKKLCRLVNGAIIFF